MATTSDTEVTVEIELATSGFEAAIERAREVALGIDALLCPICVHYMTRRARVLGVWVAVLSDRHRIKPSALLRRYRVSVHRRHLAGGCLSTRPRTPDRKNPDGSTRIHVHRCCNGCGTDLGDVREDELDAAMEGRELPDVRLECGCSSEGAAA